jgi:hypothetical protein
MFAESVEQKIYDEESNDHSSYRSYHRYSFLLQVLRNSLTKDNRKVKSNIIPPWHFQKTDQVSGRGTEKCCKIKKIPAV